MNSLVNANIKTMSSKEIAELTGKTHPHVLRDIRGMLDSLNEPKMDHEQYQEVKDNRGYTAEFLLDKELSIILVSGYSIQMRAKIVRRWIELENAPKVDTYNKICASPNTFSIRDVANFYDMRPSDLTNLLIDRKWIYRYANGNNLRVGSGAKETGLVVQKMNVRFAHSPNYLGTQVRITTKGIVRLAKVLGIARDDEFFAKMESEFGL